MFTGLIQTVGELHVLSSEAVQVVCSHNAEALIASLELGDSVSVDGVCLTVTQILTDGFVAEVSPETLRRSTLGDRHEGLVNLEPSLRVGSKLGGHFVTGHVDGIGYLESSMSTVNAWELSFNVPDARVARYIVPKGSIAVNGISLTVADCDATGGYFRVAVIPLTYAETNLQHLQVGDAVNLEGDVLGKYVEKFLRLGNATQTRAIAELEEILTPTEKSSAITPAFLAEHGYA